MRPMRSRLAALSLSTALALSAALAPAFAQEAGTEAPAAPAAPAPAAPAPEAAPAGDPAAAEMRIKRRESHGDWEVRCAPDESECFMYQLARDAQNNPVAELNIVRLPEGAPAVAGVTVLTPLGTLLRPGLAVQIDGGEKRSFPFTWCDAAGCFARFALDTASIEAYQKGTTAKLTLFSVGAPGTPVELNVSLKGFTAALDSIEPLKE